MSDLLDEIPELNPDGGPEPDTDALPTETVPGIEAITVSFGSADDLEYYVNHLEYFDENLHPLQAKWNTLDLQTSAPSDFVQANQEFWVVQRLLTIQKWSTLPDVSKRWFQRKITADTPNYESRMDEALKLSRMGSHMNQSDWEQYQTVFDKLFELHQEKLAKHSIPLTAEDLPAN